jgi:hypothetical protein
MTEGEKGGTEIASYLAMTGERKAEIAELVPSGVTGYLAMTEGERMAGQRLLRTSQ